MSPAKKSTPETAIKQPGCNTCNGLCCRHIATHIDKPTTKIDFDNIRWYLMHENVKVGIDWDDLWMLEVVTNCRYLKKNFQCAIYEKRPHICRDYPGTEDPCEHDDKSSPYQRLFTSDKELVAYLKKTKPRWKFEQ